MGRTYDRPCNQQVIPIAAPPWSESDLDRWPDLRRRSLYIDVERAAAPDYLRDQYATPDKLDIRIQAHQRYSERPDDFVDWVLDHLAPKPGESVLDIGCGRGSYHIPLVRRGARVILALDSSAGMVSTSQRHANTHGLPVVAIEASAEHIPAPDASYDLGMANHVLFHVADVTVALRELWRVLKSGGRAVLTTAGADSAKRLESLHREAALRLGYQPTGRVIDRFNMDHLGVVRSAFPTAQRDIRDDAFLFPTAEVTLRYYASGMIDAIGNRPADNSHRHRLLRLVGESVEAIIVREGVFRDPKTRRLLCRHEDLKHLLRLTVFTGKAANSSCVPVRSAQALYHWHSKRG